MLTFMKHRLEVLGLLALVTGGMLTTTGCGDGPICASEIVVLFSSMSDGDDITMDDSTAPGVQVDVPVRSNLKQGERVTLTLIDESGEVAGTLETTSDANGDALFDDVNMPFGPVTLQVLASSDKCGAGMDEVQVNVVGQALCQLTVREGLIANDFYAPLPVLNATNDSDTDLPSFQANIDVGTAPGFEVELFVLDVDAAIESSAGVIPADDQGQATFALTLAQGRQALRAECVSSGGNTRASSANTAVFVDTEAPTCTLTNPVVGTTLIPAMDIDGDESNGTQIALVGSVDAGTQSDIAGELAVFSVDGIEYDGSSVDASGTSTFTASFDAVGAHEIGFRTQDHAGNPCGVIQGHDYVTQGCLIEFVGPQGTIQSDANNDPTDGLQANLVVQVSDECVGRTITTDCGTGTAATVVPGGGLTSLDVTLCASSPCEETDTCTFSVTSPAGITTSLGAIIVADNLAPNVVLQFVSPQLTCGSAVTTSADVDGDLANGVQIDVRVISPLARTRSVDISNAAGSFTVPTVVGGDARITIEPGLNNVVAVAVDQDGNEGRTGRCDISLFDIVVGFVPPVADGLVGSRDGTVGAGALTLDLCGTVSEVGATVELAVDGGALQAATVMGTSWCVDSVALTEGTHTIDVTASIGPRLGTGSLSLRVDLTPPVPITGLAATTPDRQSALLSWTAPQDNGLAVSGYIVKIASVPLTDANFDSTGTVIVASTPGAPGASETLLVQELDAGASYYIGVAAVDAAGNRSTVQTFGPIVPDVDASGEVTAVNPSDGNNALGAQVARGDFNGDGYSDLAVAAPYKNVSTSTGVGAVYVYYGGATGIGSPVTPDVTIQGTVANGQFGNGITAIQWGGDAADDLAIGAPYVDNYNGRVYIFHGGASLSSATGPGSANVVIGVDGAGGWFGFGGLGWSLASARFDSDASDDLVIGVVGGGAGNGGIAIVYGGSNATSIMLNEANPAASNNATTLVIRDPAAATYDLFGQWIFNLGRTEGSADLDDDIGVAYFDGTSVFVIRGRQKPATPGVTLANVDLSQDLQVQNNTADTVTYFGSTMGSIEDQNGDGGRDVVIGSWGEGNYDGRVVIVDGNATGAQGVATLALTTIHPGTGVRKFGTAVVNNAAAVGNPDVNNDGQEDLLIVGGGTGFGTVDVTIFVWYGGRVPAGTTTAASAHHRIAAPASFDATILPSGGTPIVAVWAGDVNNDGLEDICWADQMANSSDGAFELLWDDGL